jgi:hypothetical protein
MKLKSRKQQSPAPDKGADKNLISIPMQSAWGFLLACLAINPDIIQIIQVLRVSIQLPEF